MAGKTEAEIEKLFISHLRTGEEYRWMGEPKENYWKLYIFGILDTFFGFWSLCLYCLAYLAAKVLERLIPSALLVMVVISVFGACLNPIGYVIFAVVFGLIVFIDKVMKDTKIQSEMKTAVAKMYSDAKKLKSNQLGQYSYYSITNQRVMISERGNILDYSLLLMADAIVSKPENGASNICIYDKTNPTGQLPEPVFELKGIVEEEAQAAYEILRMAREEALEDRAREMGIE